MKRDNITMLQQTLDLHPTKLSLGFDELEIGSNADEDSNNGNSN